MVEAIMKIFEDIKLGKQKIQELIQLKRRNVIQLQQTNIELKQEYLQKNKAILSQTRGDGKNPMHYLKSQFDKMYSYFKEIGKARQETDLFIKELQGLNNINDLLEEVETENIINQEQKSEELQNQSENVAIQNVLFPQDQKIQEQEVKELSQQQKQKEFINALNKEGLDLLNDLKIAQNQVNIESAKLQQQQHQEADQAIYLP